MLATTFGFMCADIVLGKINKFYIFFLEFKARLRQVNFREYEHTFFIYLLGIFAFTLHSHIYIKLNGHKHTFMSFHLYSRVSNKSGDGIIVADFSKRAKKNKSDNGIIVAEFLNPKVNNRLGIQ